MVSPDPVIYFFSCLLLRSNEAGGHASMAICIIMQIHKDRIHEDRMHKRLCQHGHLPNAVWVRYLYSYSEAFSRKFMI